MTAFELGPHRLAEVWRPMLSPRITALEWPTYEDLLCGDCRMVRNGMLTARAKCCTYVPPIPNFLVGEILAHGERRGAQAIRRWIEQHRGDPLFLNVPLRLVREHRRSVLPCPLLDDAGRCTIYEHRPYLCIGYRCVSPSEPLLKGLWNGFASLLALSSAMGAHLVLETIGFDRLRLVDTWATLGSEDELWTTDDAIRAADYARLWQGESDPLAFYVRCYEAVVANPSGFHDRLDRFRRDQLLRQLRSRGQLTAAREAELHDGPRTPVPTEPPPALQEAFASRIPSFAEHFFGLTEHESYLVWYVAAIRRGAGG